LIIRHESGADNAYRLVIDFDQNDSETLDAIIESYKSQSNIHAIFYEELETGVKHEWCKDESVIENR
jgi:hypothetical protein